MIHPERGIARVVIHYAPAGASTAAAQRERGARANEQRGKKFQSKRRPAGHVRNTAHKRDTASKLSGINKGKRKGKGGGRRG